MFERGLAIKDITKPKGIFALTLVAVDRPTTAFYQKLGFVVYGDPDATMPKMLLPARSVIETVEGQTRSPVVHAARL